jgi:hypothetical protein
VALPYYTLDESVHKAECPAKKVKRRIMVYKPWSKGVSVKL